MKPSLFKVSTLFYFVSNRKLEFFNISIVLSAFDSHTNTKSQSNVDTNKNCTSLFMKTSDILAVTFTRYGDLSTWIRIAFHPSLLETVFPGTIVSGHIIEISFVKGIIGITALNQEKYSRRQEAYCRLQFSPIIVIRS